jgi:hypothetical protein
MGWGTKKESDGGRGRAGEMKERGRNEESENERKDTKKAITKIITAKTDITTALISLTWEWEGFRPLSTEKGPMWTLHVSLFSGLRKIKIKNRKSKSKIKIENQKSKKKIENRKSKIKNQKSKIKNQKSKIENRKIEPKNGRKWKSKIEDKK